MLGKVQINDPNEVSTEASEGGSMGIKGLRLAKMVEVVASEEV